MTKTIAIIDYGSGNLRSAAKAFEHVITDENLSCKVVVTDQAHEVAQAYKIVLPGQGAFGDCMAGLQSVEGMIDMLHEKVLHEQVPFLGICVGMQLLATRGLEYGTHAGLDWIAGDVIPIPPAAGLKIPHMGWNDLINVTSGHPVLRSIKSSVQSSKHFYFVHSFMFDSKNKDHTLAQTTYGTEVTAIIGRDNIMGTQFHPEKSQSAGLRLISDFMQWMP